MAEDEADEIEETPDEQLEDDEMSPGEAGFQKGAEEEEEEEESKKEDEVK
jgi:hypothetical protein